MTTWFTSDHHFGHQRIIDHCSRPFQSVYAMNDGLVERWNARVEDDDEVFVIGDLTMSKTHSMLEWLTGRLRGHKILIPGNHDACWHGHKRWGRELPFYRNAGFAVWNDAWINLSSVCDTSAFGRPVIACHFPFAGDHSDQDRFVDHRPDDEGQILLHGHVHNAWKIKGRQINVGVDVWDYAPVSLDELAAAYRAEKVA